MSVWSLAVWSLLPAFAVPVIAALRDEVATRLIAVQLASAFATLLLILMSFAFQQNSYVDLALALAVLTLPGTLVTAVFIERWL